jgi:hypothetical protein
MAAIAFNIFYSGKWVAIGMACAHAILCRDGQSSAEGCAKGRRPTLNAQCIAFGGLYSNKWAHSKNIEITHYFPIEIPLALRNSVKLADYTSWVLCIAPRISYLYDKFDGCNGKHYDDIDVYELVC